MEKSAVHIAITESRKLVDTRRQKPGDTTHIWPSSVPVPFTSFGRSFSLQLSAQYSGEVHVRYGNVGQLAYTDDGLCPFCAQGR